MWTLVLFDEMTPTGHITVTDMSRHFAEEDKCLNVLPDAEACLQLSSHS